MREIKLNDGNFIPQIGFGTYKLNGDEAVDSIKYALSNGYRLIDTASKYQNEESVGKAIKESEVSRQEVLVTTKLWRENLSYENTKKEFGKSIKKLDLDYIDIFLIHWPANAKNYDDWQKANADVWKAMEELKEQGLIKSIGVSNFWKEHLDALSQTANIPPAINQIEFHPGYWQPELVDYCNKLNIRIESWSPFGRGKVFDIDLLNNLAIKYRKSVALICLKWAMQHDAIVIPKATSKERIKENIELNKFELTRTDIKAIDNLPKFGFSGELPNNWPDRDYS